MRNILYRIKRKISNLTSPSKPRFLHGARFYSNSLIDTLFPELIEIGDDFTSAPGSIILAHDASTLIHSNKYRVQKVKIGNRVFLGANSVILPGVTIGNDVIIGSGAIVSKDVTSNSVVVGNPGKIISTIDEYIHKCETRNILYLANPDFLYRINNGKVLVEEDLEKLRKFVYNQL